MRALLTCICAVLLTGSTVATTLAAASSDEGVYTLYLVRHAEKVADNSKNPDLTAAGTTRAINLATQLQDKNIEDIWSSDYTRTRETAAPLAAKLNLDVGIYDPKDQAALSSQLTQHQRNALVVGHSNTIPELAAMICNCEVMEMEETEYDRLIVIRMQDGKTELQTQMQ